MSLIGCKGTGMPPQAVQGIQAICMGPHLSCQSLQDVSEGCEVGEGYIGKKGEMKTRRKISWVRRSSKLWAVLCNFWKLSILIQHNYDLNSILDTQLSDIDYTLRICEYSRMSIRRCLWKSDIQFPLMKTWSLLLKLSKLVTTLKKVRKQINNMVNYNVSTTGYWYTVYIYSSSCDVWRY